MIEIASLSKRYGSSTAVRSLDLVVPSGELFGFLGPKRAGKTATMRTIAGILQRTLRDLFREYTRRGHTVMMWTHTLEIPEGMCDRIGILQRGELVACGTMSAVRGESGSSLRSISDGRRTRRRWS